MNKLIRCKQCKHKLLTHEIVRKLHCRYYGKLCIKAIGQCLNENNISGISNDPS